MKPNGIKQFTKGLLTLSANAYHTDKFFFEVGDRVPQSEYTTLSARASCKFGDSGFEAALWGKNLTNATIIGSVVAYTSTAGLAYMAPRSGGITLRYAF